MNPLIETDLLLRATKICGCKIISDKVLDLAIELNKIAKNFIEKNNREEFFEQMMKLSNRIELITKKLDEIQQI